MPRRAIKGAPTPDEQPISPQHLRPEPKQGSQTTTKINAEGTSHLHPHGTKHYGPSGTPGSFILQGSPVSFGFDLSVGTSMGGDMANESELSEGDGGDKIDIPKV